MHKPGTDPLDVQMTDVLCDYCHREWSESIPMIEGHHGSCVCGRCLSTGYAAVVHGGVDDGGGAFKCRMCLEERSDASWASPIDPDAFLCLRCIKLASRALEKDPDSGWRRPEAATTGS
ncbi:MAG: hypothetical protein ACO3ZY_13170 [Phycisphaerales bacterium]